VRVLERVIAKRIYETLGLPFVEKSDSGLAECAEDARAEFEEFGV
jgi:hypothetical protein